MFENLDIPNPKQSNVRRNGRANWYPYYVSFSIEFAQAMLSTMNLPRSATVLDPWNGSGTTSIVATELGYNAIGYDLNPVMTVACKARLLDKHQEASLLPIAFDLVKKTKSSPPDGSISAHDPLCTWFEPDSAESIRRLERNMHQLLVDERTPTTQELINVDTFSDLAAFYYVGLFRTVRKLIHQFIPSNPTWVKKPKDTQSRLSPSQKLILETFLIEIQAMVAVIQQEPAEFLTIHDSYSITTTSSTALPIESESIDVILTSPPYCTRVDYAVATMPELAVLGYVIKTSFDKLRRQLMGTSTVSKKTTPPQSAWGKTCIKFLNDVYSHHSKASHTYYYKNHCQYFDSLFCSINELSRVLRSGGICVLVAQDSYYKDIHNNLPKVLIEMASSCELQLGKKQDFSLRRSMAGINPTVKKYRSTPSGVESVLCFFKS